MRVYALTDLGKRVARRSEGSSEDMRVLEFLLERKTATDDEMDVVAESWVVKTLKKRGLVRELTQ